jgi:RNA polymerase sigma-70 factor (ECF subfamily)
VWTDEQLLDSFLTRHDQAAFEALVRRHGPMVLGVCRRVLPNPHDVEDAFQATFLVLIHKARALSRRELLANWLYGVAYRTAVKAKGEAARRRLHERHAGAAALMASEPAPDLLDGELGQVLDEELQRLPKKYRVPLVLCYLEGQTYEQTARQLGWTPGTVSGRLARARDLLRDRLTRRGVTFAGGLLATGLAPDRATAALPTSLLQATSEAATLLAAGNGAATGALSASVLALTKGVLHAMLTTKLKMATLVMLTLGVISTGAGLLAHHALTGNGPAAAHHNDSARPALRSAAQPPQDQEKIQGTWLVTGMERQGQPAPAEQLDQAKAINFRMVITADRITIKTDVEGSEREHAYKLDPSKKPKVIELTPRDGPQQGQTVRGIYLLEGDTLKICADNSDGKQQPAEFATQPGSELILFVLQRQTAAQKQAKPDSEAIKKAQEARNRALSVNNLKQIGLALHNYHNDFERFPAAAIYDNNGKPVLSWRVAILPYIEQTALYRQFKLDEPWDSEHNKKLLAQMPKIYAPVGVKTKEPHMTFYQVFTGKDTVFEGTQGARFADIVDGTSNTIVAVEAAEAVPWTKPDDLPYAEDKPVPKLGGLFADGYNVLFADGFVRFMKNTLDENILRLLITRNDGRVIPPIDP